MEPRFDDEHYIVKLDVFEGPLDLLLHLIRKHELDIFDIPIAFITQKYLDYLELMKELNLDLAAEYLEMAATLAFIKSKMLLPAEPDDEEDLGEDGPDPREELVRRLLEYQKYKTAAEQLASRPMLGRDTFPREVMEELTPERTLSSPGLFALIDAFQAMIQEANVDPIHEVSITRLTVSERIVQLVDLLRNVKQRVFTDLFNKEATVSDLIVTFLSVLEMTKLGLIRIHQAAARGEIYITTQKNIEDIEQVLSSDLSEDQ